MYVHKYNTRQTLMGIPSYFSYIVKNHPEIIQKFIKGDFSIDNLYIDANSIIYDSYHSLDVNEINITKIIIKNVITKLKTYIDIVSPTKKVIISFDGVAPVAKLEQQRTRRFKTWFQTTITNSIKKTTEQSWSTACITPGTSFMKELNTKITQQFNKYNLSNPHGPTIIVSSSDDPGEGEHKICHYIRTNPIHKKETTVIYGLDADLIMLAINHLPLCDKIYLFRETPDFIKSIDSNLEPNDNYLFDIQRLAMNIVTDMQQEVKFSDTDAEQRLYDYIFMCFLLGNDFLPHFPAINIRTGGVDKLLQHYKSTIGKTNKFIVNMKTKQIVWKNVHKLIASLSQQEQQYIIHEYQSRNKRERNYKYGNQQKKTELSENDKIKSVLDDIQNIPCTERTVECFINPERECWEHRYYTQLLDVEPTEDRVKQVCVNYLEGLEWTFKYYISDCPDWRWKYNYHYPPLLTDLVKHIPYFDTTFIQENNSKPLDQRAQLCYVLPRRNLSLLPYKIYNKLQTHFSNYYPEKVDFEWSYCRYFWEAHPKLPEIDIQTIETILTTS